MDWLVTVFGEGKDLDALQMSCRGAAAFVTALVLIRIAGRRTFGSRSAFDNVVMIMLGAVLSRAVVGASPVVPVVCCCAVICIVHRFLAWLSVYSDSVGRIVKGDRYCLYRNGKYDKANMEKLLITQKDAMEGVRVQLNEDTLENVDAIYIERSGRVSVVKKKNELSAKESVS